MASNVIRVSILADANKFKSALKETEQATQGIQKRVEQFSKAFVAALAVKATAAVKDFVADSVRAYSDLEQATGASQSTFGRFAEQIERSARSASQAVGLSESAYKQLASNLGAMLQNLGYSVEGSVAETEKLIGVGADFAAMYGGTVSDAVSAISSLLRGERDPIEKYAVSVKQVDINARVAALGLDTSTAAAKKNAEATAALEILYEQGGKALGQFGREADTIAGKTERLNAQLENQKAVVGELLAGGWSDVQSGFFGAIGQFIGDITTEWKMLTGEMTKGAAAVEEVRLATGGYVDTAEKAVDISARYKVRLAEVVDAADLTTEELQKLKDTDEEVLLSMGHTEEEVAALAATLEKKLGQKASETADRVLLGKLVPAVQKTTDKTEDLTEASEDAADAIRGIQDAARAASDPVFDYYQATSDLAEAQADYNAAVKKFGKDSPQAIAAAGRLADANYRIQRSVTDIGQKGVPAAIAALKQLGVPQSVINKFATDKKRIEEIFRNMVLRVKVSAPTLYPTSPASGGVGWRTETRIYSREGGIAQGARVMGEAGAEALIPLQSHTGIKALSTAMRNAMDGTQQGGGGNVYITVEAGISDPYAIAKKIAELLQQYSRVAGPLNFNVRTL